MKISPVNFSYQAFKAATVSVNALSDTHGELVLANSAIEEMRKRKEDIFCPNAKGSANVTAVCGDWFMNGGKKGFISAPDKPLAKFQLSIFNEFINQIRNIAENTRSLFVPGNHEFDGGVPLLDEVLSEIDADVIASNLNIEESDGFSKTKAQNKLFNEKIIEVEDDKNPDLKHKLLFLGIMPVNMQMYQKNLDGVSLTDVNTKNLAAVNKEDYQNTLNSCKKRIQDFKQQNPNGVVIFMCHAGANFADNLAMEAPVDLILDGHEHRTQAKLVNNTVIMPLAQNFQRIVNAKINIDDNGELKSIDIAHFNPSKNRTKGPIFELYKQLFKQDIKRTYNITSQNPDVTTLDVEGVRDGNSYLANFVTDSVLEELQKQDPSIDIFALNASAIRHSLPISNSPKISNLDIINVLAGINEDVGQIMTTELSGLQLAYLVKDNLVFSRHDSQKNPIIQYSGLSIDRKSIYSAIDKGQPPSEILQYITDTKTNSPIEADKTYKIANVEKYFEKSKNSDIKNLKNVSSATGYTVHQLFKQHFIENKDNLSAKCDVRIK